MLSGSRVLSAIPRLKNNSMLMARFMPNTVDIANNVKANKTGATTFFVAHCLAVGVPKSMGGLSMPTGGLSMPKMGGGGFPSVGGFGGVSGPAPPRHSVWGLYDVETSEPQMFITIKEYSATVGTAVAKFVSAEFAKANSSSMELKVFEADAAKLKATTFPDEAGHALFTWEIL